MSRLIRAFVMTIGQSPCMYIKLSVAAGTTIIAEFLNLVYKYLIFLNLHKTFELGHLIKKNCPYHDTPNNSTLSFVW